MCSGEATSNFYCAIYISDLDEKYPFISATSNKLSIGSVAHSLLYLHTSGFATTHVVVSTRHPITY